MDAATLRWIIIAIGVVILASIFLFGNPQRKRKPRASRRPAQPSTERREPTLDAETGADQDEPGGPGGQAELPIGHEPGPGKPKPGDGTRVEPTLDLAAEPAPRPKPRAPRKPAGPPPDRIVTLFLVARDNHVISGADLLQGALKTGLEFGDMDIFHRRAEGSDQPVFSLANAVKPGHFDREAWNTFETRALVVFMTLPGPMLALDAWDAMLATVRRLSEILDAEIQDEDHEPFTRQKEAKLREAMREYDRDRARKTLT